VTTRDREQDLILDAAFRSMRETPVDESRVQQGVENARRALQAAIDTGACRPRRPLFDACRRIIHQHRVGLAAAIAFVVVFAGFGTWRTLTRDRSGVVFADVLQQLRSARTLTFSVTVSRGGVQVPAMDETVMSTATRCERVERADGTILIVDMAASTTLELRPATRTAIRHRGVTGSLVPVDYACGGMSKDWEPNSTRIGEQVIDGRRAVGFHTRHQVGRVLVEHDVWVDPATKWVIRVDQTNSASPGMTIVMHDFAYDVPLDDALFSLDVPAGYTLTVPGTQPDTSIPEAARSRKMTSELRMLFRDANGVAAGIRKTLTEEKAARIVIVVKDADTLTISGTVEDVVPIITLVRGKLDLPNAAELNPPSAPESSPQ
jgi:hypothetical protein